MLPEHCDPGIKDAIRVHKAALLKLLEITFIVVESELVGRALFFVPGKVERTILIDCGAQSGEVFTYAELSRLVRSRLSEADVRSIIEAKLLYDGRIGAPNLPSREMP